MATGEDDNQAAQRRLREGERDDTGIVVGYLDESGNPRALTGNSEAPYVNSIPVPNSDNTLSWGSSGDSPASAYVVKSTKGVLYQVYFYNNAASTRYLFVFNNGSLPNNGDVSVVSNQPVPAGGWSSLDFGVWGLSLLNGISLGCSSTALTYTAASDGIYTALYL